MNFITKRHLPRRTFLRGAGVAVALPLLDSMVPAQTPLKETAAVAPKRFVGIWHPHGAAPGRFELRLLLHHQAAGAVPRPGGADHRPRHAGGEGDRRRTRRRSCSWR